ncbi:hypothetical protein BJN45_05215 [Azonexus hydrophilus]|uniref:Uncharacterized protein n=1 Tax=Azonexus hydrophilus TaxID=418702 RepID=A0A1R1I7H3_9RHOO|nr:hypothetical protein [Azonexus hydrophilus]OMG54624.1 hypothetical protein BJN45_05215 [Azonexus hydrophilus]
MAFSKTTTSDYIVELLGISTEDVKALTQVPIYVDLKRKAGLLSFPQELHYSDFPPTLKCKFFAYGEHFAVKQTRRMTKPYSEGYTTIEVFNIEIDRNLKLAYFKRRRILNLCKEALLSYIGPTYFGQAYEVNLNLIPQRYSKRELKAAKQTIDEYLKIMADISSRIREER